MIAIAFQVSPRMTRVARRRIVRLMVRSLRGDTEQRAAVVAIAFNESPDAFPLVMLGQGEHRRCIYGA